VRKRLLVGAAEVISIVALVGALLAWVVRLEGRVEAQERGEADRDQKIAEVKAEHREAVKQFREDLAYIRSRIDAAVAAR
jgi:hypothetical protein